LPAFSIKKSKKLTS